MNEWKLTRNELPKENGEYLVIYENIVTILNFFNGKWYFFFKDTEFAPPIAWMPLPEPYEELKRTEQENMSKYREIIVKEYHNEKGLLTRREIGAEIVRCGDCEHWECNPNTDEYGVCKKASYDDFEVVMDADDFCSYGEKKEQGHE